MYVQVGILALVGDHNTVTLTQISCNTVFSSPKMCVRQRPSVPANQHSQFRPFWVELGLIGCADYLIDPNWSPGSFLSFIFLFLFLYDFFNMKCIVDEYEKGRKEQKCDFKKALASLWVAWKICKLFSGQNFATAVQTKSFIISAQCKGQLIS